jgi:type III pantothenate kinase
VKLLVDVGNTRVKWAWLSGGDLLEPGAAAHAATAPDELAVRLAGRHGVDEVRVGSVAAAVVTARLGDALAGACRAPVRIARTGAAAAGVRNGYLEPRQLGVDRWLAMVAAYARFRTAVCVVDAGTAWTLDVIEASGQHLGGLIIPGPALMRRSLLGSTGGIGAAAELLPAGAPSTAGLGRDTEAGMRNGAWQAGACLVESCMKAWEARLGRAPVLVLTGGDAPDLGAALAVRAEHRPLLVLEGLALPETTADS